jgi:hypothetical protein
MSALAIAGTAGGIAVALDRQKAAAAKPAKPAPPTPSANGTPKPIEKMTAPRSAAAR